MVEGPRGVRPHSCRSFSFVPVHQLPQRFVYNLSVSEPFHNNMAIRAQTEQTRIDFIRVDLELCFTLADVARTAIGMHHMDHAEQAISKAEKGYSDLLQMFSQTGAMTEEVRKELESKLTQLRGRLDELRQQMR